MKHLEVEHPTFADLHAIEQKAHQLRAEALRSAVIASSRILKTGFHKTVDYGKLQLKSWSGIRLEATPLLKR